MHSDDLDVSYVLVFHAILADTSYWHDRSTLCSLPQGEVVDAKVMLGSGADTVWRQSYIEFRGAPCRNSFWRWR